MADTKITALTALTGADPANDVIPIVDVSDTTMAASGTTKKISVNNILGASGTATLASATITGDLTVATSVLKVDTANTRVGINTTSINGGPFNVKISPAIDAKFVVQDGFTTGNVRLAAVDNAYSTYKVMDYSALSHAWYNSGTTAMTLNSTGLGVGVVPSAGKGALQLSSGINFPATQVASSDANTLDDYKEGTFTPTIAGTTSAGTGTYSIQTGFYTKIGNTVFFRLRIDWSAHTGTGNMIISNLPFISSSTANSFSSVSIGYLNNIALTASSIATAFVGVNQAFVTLHQYASGGGASSAIPIDTDGAIMVSGSYIV